MQIISRNYNDIEIFFSNEPNQKLYINATKIAQHFNKQASKWLENKDTKAYIKALSRKQNFANGDLVVIVQGGKPQEQGTWIHKKLIIAFARWLSPDFAVWCDSVIEDILETGSYKIQPTKKSIQEDIEELEFASKQYEILENIFKKFGTFSKQELAEKTSNSVAQKTGIDFVEMFGGFPKETKKHSFKSSFSLTSLLEKSNIQIRTSEFNLKLEKIGVVEKRGRNWFILKPEFGINEKYENKTNPKYFEESFENLLNLVFP